MIFQCCLPLIAALAIGVSSDVPFEFQHDSVLGTQLELRVWATDAQAASIAEQHALTEIDRLSAVYSTYDASSEVSRWLASGKSIRPSADLTALLQASDAWQRTTENAYHPGTEVFSRLWKAAESSNVPPSDAVLRQSVSTIAGSPWRW